MPYPNTPAGATLISRVPFDSLTNPGWTMFSGRASIISDGSAPGSPPNVLQYRYETGFPGGIGPGNFFRSLPSVTRLFIGFFWKASNPWHGHPSNVNKILFAVGNAGGNFVASMFGPLEDRIGSNWGRNRGTR